MPEMLILGLLYGIISDEADDLVQFYRSNGNRMPRVSAIDVPILTNAKPTAPTGGWS